MNLKRITALLILIFIAEFGCGPSIPKTVLAADVDPLAFDLDTVEKDLNVLLTDWGETAFHIDDVLTRHVSYFLKYYAVQDVERSNRAIRRSDKYLHYIKNVFGDYDIPEEIAFALPFVESGFNSDAVSNADAVGMFQFIADTAKRYGLEVDDQTDDRRDFKKAAVACAKYLRDNRRVFVSTVLSLGSYHHGTKNVTDVLLTYGDEPERRFGPIFRNKLLGPFSREYIPQCLAAALIYRYLNRYSLMGLPVPEVASITLGDEVSVESLEKRIPRLHQLNPDLQGAESTYSYASTNGYVLLTELEYLVSPSEMVRTFPDWAKNPAVAPSGDIKVKGLPKTIHYVFQEHNELPVIAAIFGTSVRALEFGNHFLRKRSIRAGDVIEIRGMAPTTQVVDGKNLVCGKSLDLKTREDETLKTFCERAAQTIRAACAGSSWEMGTDLSPELIYYWNFDLLGYIQPDTPLDENMALKMYSDYLWHKSPGE